jgi:hypothetical protein
MIVQLKFLILRHSVPNFVTFLTSGTAHFFYNSGVCIRNQEQAIENVTQMVLY